MVAKHRKPPAKRKPHGEPSEKNRGGAKTDPSAPGPQPASGQRPPWHWLLSWAILAALIALVYAPTLDNEFVSFDDRKYIYENELVVGDGGLGAIWGDLSNKKPRVHYNPMTYTTWWLEHRLVGLGPEKGEASLGPPAHPLYHINQMLLHAVNAGLLMWIIRLFGGGFGLCVSLGLLFALHPLNVESVAWMAERKNLLASMFYLLSLGLYVKFARITAKQASCAKPGTPYLLYCGALASCLAALLSKSIAVTLPPMLVVADMLVHGRWHWRAVGRSGPFFLLALVFIGITIERETHLAKSWTNLPIAERWPVLFAVPVHYLEKLLLPLNQALIYPLWDLSLANSRYWVALLVDACVLAGLWRFRRRIPALAWFGFALFLLTIAPVSGLKQFIWMQFSFVSDHYMYLGTAGLLIAIGAAAYPCLCGNRTATVAATAAVAALCAFYGWRARSLADTWQNNFTLWEHTLAVNPDANVANINMGNHYVRKGQHDVALPYYLKARDLLPENITRNVTVARTYRILGDYDKALEYYRIAREAEKERYPRATKTQIELGTLLAALGRREEALAELEDAKRKSPPPQARVDYWLQMVRMNKVPRLK